MILVMDIGTSSMRGIVFDRSGNVMWKEQRSYELCVLGGGAVEMDLEVLNFHLSGVLKLAGEWLRDSGAVLDCISVTAQRASVIPVDTTGKALQRAMMWQDTRATSICEELEERKKQIYRICGVRLAPAFSAPKMKYIKMNSEPIYRAAHKLIGFQEYVLCYLDGEFTTDHSIASRTCLFNVETLEWSEELLHIFGIDRKKLCRLIPVGGQSGMTKPEINRLLQLKESVPVISAGGDQQCAALGLGCMENGQIITNSGTGSYVICVSDVPIFDDEMRISCNVSAIPGKWILEGAVLSAGKSVNWLNRQFFAREDERYPMEHFTAACEQSPAGAKGLIFLPALSGTGTPSWNPTARGSILNIGLEHNKADFARSILEGTVLQLKECIQIISKLTGETYNQIRSAGGITQNPVYNQIQADIYQQTIIQASQNEATAFGAYLSASVTLGYHRTYQEAYKQALGDQQERLYEPNKSHEKIYRRLYEQLLRYEEMLY